MTAVIYTKGSKAATCPYCVKAKALLTAKGAVFTEVTVGEDIMKEDFVSLFPNVQTVPFILIDGKQIGGYVALVEYYANQKEFLTEG